MHETLLHKVNDGTFEALIDKYIYISSFQMIMEVDRGFPKRTSVFQNPHFHIVVARGIREPMTSDRPSPTAFLPSAERDGAPDAHLCPLDHQGSLYRLLHMGLSLFKALPVKIVVCLWFPFKLTNNGIPSKKDTPKSLRNNSSNFCPPFVVFQGSLLIRTWILKEWK